MNSLTHSLTDRYVYTFNVNVFHLTIQYIYSILSNKSNFINIPIHNFWCVFRVQFCRLQYGCTTVHVFTSIRIRYKMYVLGINCTLTYTICNICQWLVIMFTLFVLLFISINSNRLTYSGWVPSTVLKYAYISRINR